VHACVSYGVSSGSNNNGAALVGTQGEGSVSAGLNFLVGVALVWIGAWCSRSGTTGSHDLRLPPSVVLKEQSLSQL